MRKNSLRNADFRSSFDRANIPTTSCSSLSATSTSFLHLLLPATEPNLNLCKTLLSAAVLNYSTPTLVNWDQEFDTPGLSNGGSHIAKITGVLRYLEGLGPENEEDVVVLADGYDVWFQLGPEVLLSRFYEANQKATARSSRRLCGSGTCSDPTLSHVSQSIIFSAQKRCWPHDSDELACYGIPPSTLPHDIFGSDTDVFWPNDQENHYLKMRPRWLNSGFMIGAVGPLRRFFAEAERRMLYDPHRDSDQGVLSDIIGAQEYAREVVRQRHLARNPLRRFQMALWAVFHGKSSYHRDRDAVLAPSPTKETLLITAEMDLAAFEFGVGIDYESTFSVPTVFAHRDGDWVTFNKPDAPSAYWHIKSPYIQPSSLPQDLAKSTNAPLGNLVLPNYNINQDNQTAMAYQKMHHGRSLAGIWTNLPSAPSTQGESTGWGDVPLYANLRTALVPVAIHHNAWENDMKRHRETMWGQSWWSAYARPLLQAHDAAAPAPIAVVHDPVSGKRREFWNPIEKSGGVRLDNGTVVDLDLVCGPPLVYEEDVSIIGDQIVANGTVPWVKERMMWQEELFWVNDGWQSILKSSQRSTDIPERWCLNG